MDWAFLVLVLAFAVRGWIRGCFSQLFAFAGLLAGLWVAAWVSQWVGLEWQHARPAAVFWVLRALTVLLAGLATAAVLASIGERAREAAEGGLLGFLDRGAGLLLGVAFGASGAQVGRGARAHRAADRPARRPGVFVGPTDRARQRLARNAVPRGGAATRGGPATHVTLRPARTGLGSKS